MALNLHHTKNELFRPNEIDRKVAFKDQKTDTNVRWTLMRVLKHDTIILYERKDSMVTLNPKELFEAGDITLL